MDIYSVDHGIMKGFCGAASLDWRYPDNEKSGGCHRMLLGSLQGSKNSSGLFVSRVGRRHFFKLDSHPSSLK